MCGFCIGMGYTGEELVKKGSKNVEKLKKNDRFFMSGVFRGALEPGIGPGGQKNIPYSETMSDLSHNRVFGLFSGIYFF